MHLNESTAAHVLGFLPPEKLPGVAAAWLEGGLDSKSLAVLAGETSRSDPHLLRSLFESALRELGHPLPTPIHAGEVLKRHYASQVAGGEIPPRQGARFIVERVFREIDELLPPGEYLGESFGIARLVGLFYNYDDVEDDDLDSIAEIDTAIIEECKLLVGEPAA